MKEAIASFTPDQLQLIGLLVVTFGASFIGLVWKTAIWKTKLENDVDNLGNIIGTEKGMDLARKRYDKLKKQRGE